MKFTLITVADMLMSTTTYNGTRPMRVVVTVGEVTSTVARNALPIVPMCSNYVLGMTRGTNDRMVGARTLLFIECTIRMIRTSLALF